jgi:hypothetical protein
MNTLQVMQNAEQRDALATEYATMAERFGVVTGLLDSLWLKKRAENPEKTDKYIDKVVGASELGKEFNALKFKMKGYDKRMSSLNGIITVANNEARNLY